MNATDRRLIPLQSARPCAARRTGLRRSGAAGVDARLGKRRLRAGRLVAAILCLLCPLSLRAGGVLTANVDGKISRVNPNGAISISSSAKGVTFRFEADQPAANPARVRFKLDGVDDRWRDGKGEMFLSVRFLDASGDQLSLTSFSATGESAGWKGSLGQSAFTHRRETLAVPPGAASFWIVITSAGPPATLGIFGVSRIAAFQLSADGVSRPVGFGAFHSALRSGEDAPLAGWIRDGSRRSMAKLAELDGGKKRALAVADNDPAAHAEWHTAKDAAPRLEGATALLVEWDEAYSIGVADLFQASYSRLAPGQYALRIQDTDIQGAPIGDELRFHLTVRPPFWRTSWFWIACGSAVSAAAIGSSRYREWRRMRQEIARFKQERALDRERLRIAQDIHDDLGARVTHISLISAMGGRKASDADQARATFDQISGLTRDLVFALYQTVWAVDPENDSLEALVDHLCQISGKQCAPANIRCRLHVAALPSPVAVSSEARHNISMSVGEAVHNAVKHSSGDEISLTVEIADSALSIAVRDNGDGFDIDAANAGHGLANMRRRMERIGGTVRLAAGEPRGAVVAFSVPLSRLSGFPTPEEDGRE